MGSPRILMLTSQVTEPSPTTGILSGKVSVTEAFFAQVPSTTSEEHVDYLGDELDFSVEPSLLETSNFTHISEEEI